MPDFFDTLLPQHQQQLKDSGISSAVAETRGYLSLDGVDGLQKLKISKYGPSQYKLLPGLLFPLWSVFGERHEQTHYRPDTPRYERKGGKIIKYEYPSNSEPVLDVHPLAYPFITKSETPLWITEGEKKADSLLSHGASCVLCLGGVWSWKRNDVAHKDFVDIVLEGREVRIVFDSDIATNRSVRKAHDDLATYLYRRKAIVYTINLPSQHEKKIGVDDYLMQGHTLEDLDDLCRAWDTKDKRSQVPPSSFAPVGTPLSDVYNAEQLALKYGRDLRHCATHGGWHAWTGTHWAVCREASFGTVWEMARSTLRSVGRAGAEGEDGPLMRHVSRSFSHGKITAMIDHAATLPGMSVASTIFNQHPWLLNCVNGTIDLRTGYLREHQRNEYLTHCLGIPYTPLAPCPQWQQYLQRTFQDAPDIIPFMQRAIGYSLTGSTQEECLFLLWGTGRNGKSVLVNTIQAVLGTYGSSTQMDTFLHHAQETIRNDLAALQSVRMVSAVETKDGNRFDEGIIKQMTGHDAVSARFLRQEFFSYIPAFKIWLAFNHRPEIRGTDVAIWERVHLIPFTTYITPEERIKDLGDVLAREELPGILAWAVQGCLDWQQDGLRPPAAVLAATQAYKSDQDILGQFFDEICVIDNAYYVHMSLLYQAYEAWAKGGNEYVMTKSKFTRRLGEDYRVKVGPIGYKNDRLVYHIKLKDKESESP